VAEEFLTADGAARLAHATILVVDDEPGMRNFLSKILGPRVKRVLEAADPAEASKLLDQAHVDLIVLDNLMPGQKGLEWLAGQRGQGLFAETILITAYADLETAIEALRVGVTDFILKPFRANQILAATLRALDCSRLRRDNQLLRHALGASPATGQLLGRSPAIAAVREMVARLAPLNTPVLITGDSGTGKEVAARALHAQSDRADAPFVAVNCAAIAPERLAHELFGVSDGTGEPRPGLFMLAEGGTLLLDEVAQMPAGFQAALLRVLEDHRIRPVGASRDMPVDLRLCFCTNTDLRAEVEAGRFRADLFHRINVVEVRMPRLSERADDIIELAALFMRQLSEELGAAPLPLDDETLLHLSRHDWPGNVRELRNLIERSLILGSFPEQFAGQGQVTGAAAIETLELVEQRHILSVLDRCGGNRAEAARRLGVSRKTIDRKCATWSG
jgi:DNA-binding NtrC family response regulator